MERPDLQRMLRAIERRQINLVITKDLSRLGRNYLQTGHLIEDFFPRNGVRYIACLLYTSLDAPYYHVVFTVPDELNSIIYSNQKLLYDVLYHAASATLNELAKDAKYLGANIGYICILHTWGSAMNYHCLLYTSLIPTAARCLVPRSLLRLKESVSGR